MELWIQTLGLHSWLASHLLSRCVHVLWGCWAGFTLPLLSSKQHVLANTFRVFAPNSPLIAFPCTLLCTLSFARSHNNVPVNFHLSNCMFIDSPQVVVGGWFVSYPPCKAPMLSSRLRLDMRKIHGNSFTFCPCLCRWVSLYPAYAAYSRWGHPFFSRPDDDTSDNPIFRGFSTRFQITESFSSGCSYF